MRDLKYRHSCQSVFIRGQLIFLDRNVLEITVNGASHRFDTAMSVAALVEQLELVGKRIAVERNGEIVPRSQFGNTVLASGDKLEIVVAVGGG